MKPRDIVKTVGCIFIALGLFIVIGSLYINIRQQAMKKSAIAEFKNRVVASETILEEHPIDGTTSELTEGALQGGSAAVEGDILYMLRIPCIDSENPVREGVSAGVLADSLGHEPDTAYIGEGGNCVIAGHRNYSFGSFFNRLNEVKEGDMIYVDTATDSYSYTVVEIKVVEPEDLSVLEPTDTETLTLYTCTPLYLATHRLVIIANRIED
ncbi:MAG: class D sortase [Lachnospiraceae bacterium]|nr:class D sortase [Lachnospiraceae bacterium]